MVSVKRATVVRSVAISYHLIWDERGATPRSFTFLSEEAMKNFKPEIVYIETAKLKLNPNNPRKNDEAVPSIMKSIEKYGFKNPLVCNTDYVVYSGNTRLKAARKLKLQEVPCIIADDLTPEELREFAIVDNKTSELAEWDDELLKVELEELEGLSDFAFDFSGELPEAKPQRLSPGADFIALEKRFVIPPFTVFDTRQGYWSKRKQAWLAKIKDDGSSRNTKLFPDSLNKINGNDLKGVSILDPVLAEIIVRWFAPKNAKVFDCFAGDTAFGYVSSELGCDFTGIELREEQVAFNQQRMTEDGLNGKYICDDGRNVKNHIADKSQDLLFSCPPYFDLEVYSDKENDASNQKTYEAFYEIIETAFTNALDCLKDDRFAVVVVGDIRNKKTGGYYDFIGDIKRTFMNKGCMLYNEIILINQIATGAIRAAKQMETRKVVKVHQNVLVFYKGQQQNIKQNFEKIDFSKEELGEYLDESADI